VPLRSDWSADNCPIARGLDVLGDPWVLLILREAFTGTRRFERFRDDLGIAHNVLSARLRTMVDAGLLRKEPYRAERRTHHEYLLTERGADTLPILHTLLTWSNAHAPGSVMTASHTPCGAELRNGTCPACGQVPTPDTVTWHRPWHTPETTPLISSASGGPADGS
jgi:DNA-binding HxlR family transcriptional regulator